MHQLMAAIVPLGLLGACLGPDGGSMPSNGLVITTASSGGSNVLYAFDPGTGRVDAWPPLGAAVYGGVLSADSRTLFLSIRNSGFRSDLVAINARSGNALWSLTIATAGQPRILDGVGLLTGEVMAVASDDSLLYLWRSVKDSVVGIAALNLKTQRPVAFSGPWNVAAGGIQPMTQRCNAPRAVLMLVADRQNASGGPRRDEAVYTLDAHTLAPLDSISLPELGASPAEDVWQALPSADGRTLYVATSTRIVRYDPCNRSILASTTRPATGMLAVVAAAAETTLILTDVGVWPDTPGSGFIYLLDQNLDLLDSIDVSTPIGGDPKTPTATVTGSAAGGSDGRTVYVRAGSDEVGPLYPPQPARLLVLDFVNRRLVRAVDLTGFGLGLLFAPRN